MNCPNCGTFNNDGSKFCLKCGHNLVNTIDNSTINIMFENNNVVDNSIQNNSTLQSESIVNFNNDTNINQNTNYNYNNINDNQSINSNYNIYNKSNLNTNKNKKSFFNKKNIIVFVLIAVVLLAFGGFFLFKDSKNKNLNTDINEVIDDNELIDNNSSIVLDKWLEPNKPIVIKNNGKYGYITSEGENLIEPQYDEASEFYGNYAAVSFKNGNITTNNQIIDKNGNVKLDGKYGVTTYHPLYDSWNFNEKLYNSNLKKVSADGMNVTHIYDKYFEYNDHSINESGIITSSGEKVLTVSGSYSSFSISENEYNKNDLYAVVSTQKSGGTATKQYVISLKTGDILFSDENAVNLYIGDDENGLVYRYNNEDGFNKKEFMFFINNKLAYQTPEKVYDVSVYNYVDQILEINYGSDYQKLGKSQQRYYYDVKNNKMLENKPVTSISEDDLELQLIEQKYGFREYYSHGNYGIMAGEKLILPVEYDDVLYLDLNLFNYMKSKGKEPVLLKKEKQLLIYDLKNSEVIATFGQGHLIDNDHLDVYLDEYISSTFIKLVMYEDDGYSIKEYLVYNILSGKSMTFENIDEDDIFIGSNYINVKKDGKVIYYNTDFKQVYETNEN